MRKKSLVSSLSELEKAVMLWVQVLQGKYTLQSHPYANYDAPLHQVDNTYWIFGTTHPSRWCGLLQTLLRRIVLQVQVGYGCSSSSDSKGFPESLIHIKIKIGYAVKLQNISIRIPSGRSQNPASK